MIILLLPLFIIIFLFTIVFLFIMEDNFHKISTIIKRYKKHQENPGLLEIVNLTFNQFEKIVNVNPSRWSFDLCFYPEINTLDLKKDIYKEFKSYPHNFYYRDDFANYRIIFSSFSDYIKFERWLKRYEKEREQIQKIKKEIQINKNLENFLKSVKTDIDKLQKEANEEIKKSLII